MAQPFLGQIMIFAGNFAPTGWAMCDGQLLPISQNQALFSLLGTNYGGNGVNNFALPNLQGRFPLGMGNGAGLSPVIIGQTGGTEQVTLSVTNLPSHTHPLNASNTVGTQSTPGGASIAEINAGSPRSPQLALGFAPGTPASPMASGSIGPTGGGQPVGTLPPYLGLNFIIALQGIYPSRS